MAFNLLQDFADLIHIPNLTIIGTRSLPLVTSIRSIPGGTTAKPRKPPLDLVSSGAFQFMLMEVLINLLSCSSNPFARAKSLLFQVYLQFLGSFLVAFDSKCRLDAQTSNQRYNSKSPIDPQQLCWLNCT